MHNGSTSITRALVGRHVNTDHLSLDGRVMPLSDRNLAYIFGFLFCAALLVLAVAFPHPSPSTFLIFRVVLSTAAAGVGSVVPGILVIHSPYIRAGGALALFVIVFFFNPPALATAQ